MYLAINTIQVTIMLKYGLVDQIYKPLDTFFNNVKACFPKKLRVFVYQKNCLKKSQNKENINNNSCSSWGFI